MRVVNNLIPRVDRALVQSHLDALNAILPAPDVTQLDVEVNATSYTLEATAAVRVTQKLAWLVGHQTPSPTGATLPSVAPTVKAACAFFSIALPAAPTGAPSVDEGIDPA